MSRHFNGVDAWEALSFGLLSKLRAVWVSALNLFKTAQRNRWALPISKQGIIKPGLLMYDPEVLNDKNWRYWHKGNCSRNTSVVHGKHGRGGILQREAYLFSLQNTTVTTLLLRKDKANWTRETPELQDLSLYDKLNSLVVCLFAHFFIQSGSIVVMYLENRNLISFLCSCKHRW